MYILFLSLALLDTVDGWRALDELESLELRTRLSRRHDGWSSHYLSRGGGALIILVGEGAVARAVPLASILLCECGMSVVLQYSIYAVKVPLASDPGQRRTFVAWTWRRIVGVTSGGLSAFTRRGQPIASHVAGSSRATSRAAGGRGQAMSVPMYLL